MQILGQKISRNGRASEDETGRGNINPPRRSGHGLPPASTGGRSGRERGESTGEGLNRLCRELGKFCKISAIFA